MTHHTSRYIIGIDLGTTNTAVSFVDTADIESSPAYIQPFPILQATSEKNLDTSSILPSVLYVNQSEEGSPEVLPNWARHSRYIFGQQAKVLGKKRPLQLLHSAKSWLSNPQAARKNKILPIYLPNENEKISPLQAQENLLRYIKDAWNHKYGEADPFEDQEIIITIPASFDEVARQLTVEAANLAGYRNITLLEEPQAAFYYWIYTHRGQHEKFIQPGSTALVCDIGGGTTDFTLISVSERNGKIHFERNFIGNHLLLGGDNMDLALAHSFKEGLSNKESKMLTLDFLKPHMQSAKENMFSKSDVQEEVITIFSEGRGVVGNAIKGSLPKKEMLDQLIKGFFPSVEWDGDIGIASSKAVQTIGLPYATEPAITKHLAQFLKKALAAGISLPTHILFNGAVMKAQVFQDAIHKCIQQWKGEPIKALSCAHLDLAVSRGAAYYGLTRRGEGVKISGGHATGYYIEVKKSENSSLTNALSLIPRGAESGFTYTSPELFQVETNTPINFKLFSSQTRLNDKPGDLIQCQDQELSLVSPLVTQLSFGKNGIKKKVHVELEATLTDIGTVEFNLVEKNKQGKWSLAFQVRSIHGDDSTDSRPVGEDINYDPQQIKDVLSNLKILFESMDASSYSQWIKTSEEVLHSKKNQWSVSFIRSCFDILNECSTRRNASSLYFEKFWNLTGFLLRPGIGYAVDEGRVKQMWRWFCEDVRKPIGDQENLQILIAMRRVAPGLNKGQQTTLFNTYFNTLVEELPKAIKLKKLKKELFAQRIKLLTALEMVEQSHKKKLAKLLEKYRETENIEILSGIKRLASRQPLFAGLGEPIFSETISEWAKWARNKLNNPSVDQKDYFLQLLATLTFTTGNPRIDLECDFKESILDSLQDDSLRTKIDGITTQNANRTKQQIEKQYGDSLPNALTLLE